MYFKIYLKHVPDVVQNTTSVCSLQIYIFKMHQFTVIYYRAVLRVCATKKSTRVIIFSVIIIILRQY